MINPMQYPISPQVTLNEISNAPETVFINIDEDMPNSATQRVSSCETAPFTRENVLNIWNRKSTQPINSSTETSTIPPNAIHQEEPTPSTEEPPLMTQNNAEVKTTPFERKNTPLDKKTAEQFKQYANFMGSPDRTNYSLNLEKGQTVLTTNTTDQNPTELTKNLLAQFPDNEFERKGKTFVHKETGVKFHIVVDENTKEVGVCFYGLGMGPKTGNKGIKSAIREFLGGKPKAADVAKSIGEKVKQACQGKGFKAVMIGHSHGGGLAQYAAASNGVKGVVFNSRPLGAGLKRQLQKAGNLNNEKEIHHFSAEGDFLTDNKFFNFLSKGLKKIGGRNAAIPQNIGHQYKMEKGKIYTGGGFVKNLLRKHNNYHAQIMNAAHKEDQR